jgi:geranylgeranyl diphosphate synthase type I
MAADLVEEAGGRALAGRQARHHLDVSERILNGTPMPADVRGEFLNLAQFITARDH